MRGAVFSVVGVAGLFFSWLILANRKAENMEREPVTGKAHNGNNHRADSIYWGQVQYFTPDEFHGELHDLDAAVIFVLDKLRAKVGRLMISPAKGAVTREAPGSMHDITGNKLSKAIDVMPLDVSLAEFYEAVKTIPAIGGIGLYPDWNPHPGAHIDLRVRKSGGRLATWSGKTIKLANGKTEQAYLGIDEALA